MEAAATRRREGPHGSPAHRHLGLGLAAPRAVRNEFLLLKPPRLWSEVMAAQADPGICTWAEALSGGDATEDPRPQPPGPEALSPQRPSVGDGLSY